MLALYIALREMFNLPNDVEFVLLWDGLECG